jgi:ankyrin repeat protein
VGFVGTAWAAEQLQNEGHRPGEAEEVLRMMLDWAPATKDSTDQEKNTPLMYAVSSGNAAAVDILLESGADFQVLTDAGETALSRAVSTDGLSIAERILKEGRNRASLPHVYLHHALSAALRAGRQPFIELLLQNGADIDDRDERGDRLLSTALEPFLSPRVEDEYGRHDDDRINNDPGLVTVLLKNGATPGDFFPDILQAAIDNVAPDWIRHLHDRGFNVVGPLTQKGALAAVLEAAIPDLWELYRAFPDQPEKRHRAYPLIKLLLEVGVHVQPGDLQRAVRLRSPEDILVALLGEGTSNNTGPDHYGTPVQTLLNNEFWDGRAAEQERILGLLIGGGCDVNLDSPGWKATPLQIACSRSDFFGDEVYQRKAIPEYSDKLPMMLLRAGADVHLSGADTPGTGIRLIKSTPIELACLTGKTEVVVALLEAGAMPNTPVGEFGQPLQAACMQFGQRRRDDVEIVRALLIAGADVNAAFKPGGTALVMAAHSLLPELVKALLEAGADPTINVAGETEGAFQDAWDALHQPPRQLFDALKSTFDGMQTGPFKCEAVRRDREASLAKWEQIKEMFAQYGIVHPEEKRLAPEGDYYRPESICFQEEFAHLSPEEIRLSDYTIGPRYGPELPPALIPQPAFDLRLGSAGPASDSNTSQRPSVVTGRRRRLGVVETVQLGTHESLLGTNSVFGSVGENPGQGGFGTNSGQRGLFGSAPEQPAFGGFGSKTGTSGGLFGSSSAAPKSLFGSNTPAFGNVDSDASQGRYGGLFGSGSTQGGGLFGSSPTQRRGGLFGSTPTQQGLFGSGSSSVGGLFGSRQEKIADFAEALPPRSPSEADQWQTESGTSSVQGGAVEPTPAVQPVAEEGPGEDATTKASPIEIAVVESQETGESD